MRMTGTTARHAAATWRQLRDILLPRGCAGCGRPDAILCDQCARALHDPTAFTLPQAAAGHGVACGTYHGAIRHAILSWKDHGDAEADQPLADALTDLFDTVAAPLLATLNPAPTGVGIIPAPSSPRSIRRRGRRHLDPLADMLAAHCRSHGLPDTCTLPMLQVRAVHGKSVQTHGARDRMRRIHGHIAVDDAIRPPAPGTPLILLDDIVTTGATIGACAVALADAGHDVLTALALAYTPPKAIDEDDGTAVEDARGHPGERRW